MKLISCHIENFGVLSDFDLNFDEGLTVVNQKNGFGKTTLAVFIKTMFYGFPRASRSEDKNDRKKYMPWGGGTYGGFLVFEHEESIFRLERTFSEMPRNDTWALYEGSSMTKNTRFSKDIGYELFKLDVEGYEKSTYMPQSRDGISFSNGSIQAALNKLADDAYDIANYDKAVGLLEDCRRRIIPYKGNGGTVNELLHQISELEEGIAGEADNKQEYESLNSKILEGMEQSRAYIKEIEDTRNRISQVSISEATRVTHNQHREMKKELEEAEAKLSALNNKYRNSFPTVEAIEDMEECFYDISRLEKESLSDKENHIVQTEKTKATGYKHFILFGIGFVLLMGGVYLSYSGYKSFGVTVLVLGALAVLYSFLLNFKKLGKVYNKPYTKDSAVNYADEIDERRRVIAEYANKFGFDEIADRAELKLISEDINHRSMLSDYIGKTREKLKSFENKNADALLMKEEYLNENLQQLMLHEQELNRNSSELGSNLLKLGRQKEELKQKMSRYPDMKDELTELKNEMKAQKEKVRIIEETIEYLSKAKAELNSSYLEPIRNGFEYYASLISHTKNPVVHINQELELIPEERGSLRSINSMSTGYIDIMEICMRFALADALFTNKKMFIILDDPFVNLDDEHVDEALSILNELAQSKHIVYMVCNSSRI